MKRNPFNLTPDEIEARDAAFGQRIIQYTEISSRLQDTDDRKLLWLLYRSKLFESVDAFSPTAALVNSLEDRLYPEYDGERVSMTEYGWETPEGAIVYDQTEWKKAGEPKEYQTV